MLPPGRCHDCCMASGASTKGSDDGDEFWLGGSETSALRLLMNVTPGLRLVVREVRRSLARSDAELS